MLFSNECGRLLVVNSSHPHGYRSAPNGRECTKHRIRVVYLLQLLVGVASVVFVAIGSTFVIWKEVPQGRSLWSLASAPAAWYSVWLGIPWVWRECRQRIILDSDGLHFNHGSVPWESIVRVNYDVRRFMWHSYIHRVELVASEFEPIVLHRGMNHWHQIENALKARFPSE